MAAYYLRCDAIGQPVSDPNDQRRLNSLTISMAQHRVEQSLGYGNRAADVQKKAEKNSMHMMVAGKRAMEDVIRARETEYRDAKERLIASVGAATASVFRSSTCGGGASFLMYIHCNRLMPGEHVTQTGLIEDDAQTGESRALHEYVEVRPSEQEEAEAVSRGETRHSVVGDTWLTGSTAMLKLHTRHANSGFRSVDNFSIGHENAAKELEHFCNMKTMIEKAFLPELNEALNDIRSKYHDLPELHPLDGKSIASPEFVRRATEALQQMDPATRREKAFAALEKAEVDLKLRQRWADRVVDKAMTIHDEET